MARQTINGRPLTVREAIFLATSRTLTSVPGIATGDTLTLTEVRAVRDLLVASKSRDLNIDTARSEAEDALDFRTRLGY